MAKSKTGGTRSYMRGRVGSDVYTIGKDGKGNKQQVVRSLAESVANPRTIAQMRGRMIMSTIMQARAGLKAIIDHSFDGFDGAQANLSEFSSRNYALVKADVAANPEGSNVFGLNKFNEKGIKQGAYIISNGDAILPASVTLDTAIGEMVIAFGSNPLTIAGLKAALGLSSDEYLTLVGISEDNGCLYKRLRINPAKADEFAIAAGNVAECFAVEGNAPIEIVLNGTNIQVTCEEIAYNCGIIVSRKVEGGFIHNTCQLSTPNAPQFKASDALPTYPVGESAFLNGGDIFGMDEMQGDGVPVPEPEPEPEPTAQISSLKIANVSVARNTAGHQIAEGALAVQVAVANMPTSGTVELVSGTNITTGSNVSSLAAANRMTIDQTPKSGSMTFVVGTPSGKQTVHVCLAVDNVVVDDYCTCLKPSGDDD